MEQFLQAVGPALGQFGAPVLLATITLMFPLGKILAKPTVDKLLVAKDEKYEAMEKAKDEKFDAMELYFNKIIQNESAHHVEIRDDLRVSSHNSQEALNVSARNVQELLKQQEELMNITRVTSSTLNARARVEITDGHSGA